MVERSKPDKGGNRVQQLREEPSPIDGDGSDSESDRAGRIWMWFKGLAKMLSFVLGLLAKIK